jgi:hypothetical protein
VSSRTARAIKRNPVSKNQKRKRKKKKKTQKKEKKKSIVKNMTWTVMWSRTEQ